VDIFKHVFRCSKTKGLTPIHVLSLLLLGSYAQCTKLDRGST